MDTRILRLSSSAEFAAGTRAGKLPVTLQDQVAEIYESLREEVYRYLLVLGVGPDLAQEICQEVFLRLYGTLRKGQKIDNTRAWIFYGRPKLRSQCASIGRDA
jgi:hypothetical protein